MADGTKIEWTDATVNAVNGCSVVSPGCTNCYAMRLAGTRLRGHPTRDGLTQDSNAGPVWTGEVRLNEKALLDPLKWRRPRRIFWNAHGDLFHPSVPEEWIDRVFAVCALTPHHTHQILTKRSARMRAYVSELVGMDPDERLNRFDQIACDLTQSPCAIGPFEDLEENDAWPLANVWMGVSVEDQQRANERIPDLLATPAAVRWISAEPLLGPINIRNALRPRQPFSQADLPEDWSGFVWPEWVPETVRARVMDFWRRDYGRGPRAWLRDAITRGGPALWSEATLHMLTNAGDPISGRFVHFWNNIGCVVMSDGSFAHGSFTGSGVYTAVLANGRGLDWVVVGGESGAGARPMHPDWARSLRDQCAAAGVAFLFKQWGEWRQGGGGVPIDVRKYRSHIAYVDRDTGARKPNPNRGSDETMIKLGKAEAGRLLDGVQHDGYPA